MFVITLSKLYCFADFKVSTSPARLFTTTSNKLVTSEDNIRRGFACYEMGERYQKYQRFRASLGEEIADDQSCAILFKPSLRRKVVEVIEGSNQNFSETSGREVVKVIEGSNQNFSETSGRLVSNLSPETFLPRNAQQIEKGVVVRREETVLPLGDWEIEAYELPPRLSEEAQLTAQGPISPRSPLEHISCSTDTKLDEKPQLIDTTVQGPVSPGSPLESCDESLISSLLAKLVDISLPF